MKYSELRKLKSNLFFTLEDLQDLLNIKKESARVLSPRYTKTERISYCVLHKDAFDMEFLLKKGIGIDASPQTLKKIIKIIDSLTKRDNTVKLDSLLEETERNYYITENFKILKSSIKEQSLQSERFKKL